MKRKASSDGKVTAPIHSAAHSARVRARKELFQRLHNQKVTKSGSWRREELYD